MAWQDRALCARVDGDAWFPEIGGPANAAKQICSRCPVRRPCLTAAIDGQEQHGIWGGLTYPERLSLGTPRVSRQARDAAAHAQTIAAGTAAEAAALYGVSQRTVERWRARNRKEAEAA